MKFSIKKFTTTGQSFPSTIATVDGTYNDLALTDEEVAAQDWRTMTDQAAESVLHINSPFVFNGRNKQIISYDKKVYARIEAECIRQCKIYFDKEDPEAIVVEEPKVVVRHVAKYPGIYPSPTKTNPGRFVANYRKDGRTIKIGFFDSEEEAHEAKQQIIDPVKF